MSGHNSRYMRHKCNQHGCYIEALPMWDDICGCFGGSIRPTDIDGMVEINNRFLFLEEKRAGVSIPEGQRIALKRLGSLGRVTVVAFRPCADNPLLVQLLIPSIDPRWQKAVSRAEMLQRIAGWAQRARAAPP